MTTNFCVRLDEERGNKLRLYLAGKNKTGRKFIEEAIDRIKPTKRTK
jgi:hypothetical protein